MNNIHNHRKKQQTAFNPEAQAKIEKQAKERR